MNPARLPNPRERNKQIRRLFLLILPVLTAVSFSADCQTVLKRDTQAVVLLNQGIQKAGFDLSDLLDTRASGTVKLPDGTTGTFVSESLGSRIFRNQLTLSTGQTSLAVFGDKAFLTRDGKRKQLPVWIAQSSRLDILPSATVAASLARKDLSIIDEGAVTVSGTKYRHLHLIKSTDHTLTGDIDEEINDIHVYLDPVSNQVSRIRSRLLSGETSTNGIPIDTLYDDYRLVDGLTVPFHIIYYSGDKKQMEMFLNVFTAHAGNTPGTIR